MDLENMRQRNGTRTAQTQTDGRKRWHAQTDTHLKVITLKLTTAKWTKKIILVWIDDDNKLLLFIFMYFLLFIMHLLLVSSRWGESFAVICFIGEYA